MENGKNRYANMERTMTLILAALLILFIIFLTAAGNGIIWLKVTTGIVAILTGLLSLVYLYLSGELLRQRSLWISTAFAAIVICTLFSLILNFPCPKP